MTSKGVDRQAKTMFCPNSDGKNDLREILYGLPGGPPDPRVYRLWGCCVNKDDPELICVSCGWQGKAEEKRSSFDG
jgi:hypothetical protein